MKTFNRKIVVISLFAISFGFSSCMPSATQIMRHPNFTWVKDSSNRFYIHMEKSIWTQKRMDSIKLAMENNFAFVMQKLQNDFFPYDRIHHFIVENPNSIKTIIEAVRVNEEYLFLKDTLGIQSFFDRYLVTTFGQNSPYSRERDLLSIIIINSIWDLCPSYLDHSIGIFVNDSWKGYHLHDLAAYFYKNSFTFDQFFGTLYTINQFSGKVSLNQPFVLYPLTASLLKYAADKHGMLFAIQRCRDQFIRFFPLQRQVISEWEAMLKERYNQQTARIDTIRYLQYPR